MDDAQRIYLIAEAGINHGGDMDVAARMIAAAADAGVDAVKFQSFSAAGLTHSVLAADQHEFFSRYELSREEHRVLALLCREREVDFLSTPFDFAMVDLLAELNVPAFKIASCDLTNLPLIEAAAKYGKPLFISTGMGELEEARTASEAARAAGSPRVVLLQCTTNYPTAYEDVNVRAMTALRSVPECEAGFSDHSVGNYACFAAATLGAAVIEKHFCLDKTAVGPDIAGSCSPAELADLVRGVRAIERALGSATKALLASEREVALLARRSIYYARNLPAGHLLELADFALLRPGNCLSPAHVHKLAGRALLRPVAAGAPAALDDVEWAGMRESGEHLLD